MVMTGDAVVAFFIEVCGTMNHRRRSSMGVISFLFFFPSKLSYKKDCVGKNYLEQ